MRHRLGVVVVLAACGSPSPKSTLPPPPPTPPAPPARPVREEVPLPKPEIVESDVRLDLPPVPSFDLPPAPADGSHGVKELRVRGTKLLDTKVVVHGFITWRYDCATAVRQPDETDKDVKKRIDADPTLCERPKFYVGDTADTSPEKSLWVVDVPRPYNKLEVARIAKKDRTMPDRCEPNDKKQRVCPPYAVGDEVEIMGDFKLASPHWERNSDGLLVYEQMRNLTQAWQSAGAIAAKPISEPSAPPPESVPPPAIATSSEDPAANHLEWYRRGETLAHRGDWTAATEAFEHAVAARPDAAMYQLLYGIALYERSVAAAREEQARRRNVKPEELRPDLSAINFEKSLQHLQEAVKIEPRLWRGHYYLGRIYREVDKPKLAAEEFSRAIQGNPRQAGPYVALGELYRKWDYTDQAIQLTSQGTTNVPGAVEVSNVWYVLAMAYDDKRSDDKAIDAYTKALETDRHNVKARFQRGQAYYRKGDFVNARRDLEEFSKNTGTLEFARQQASMMLMNIAAKAATH